MLRRLALYIAAISLGCCLDTLLSSLNYVIAAPATAPAFFVVDTKCAENVGTCTVAISATGGNGRGSWIQATTSNGTAIAPGDYGARSSPIYVSPGHSTTFSFPVVNDKLLEGDEYLFVTITTRQNAQIGRARGVVTIVDDDIPAPPPPPPAQWIAAPLQDGGFAKIVNANDSLWPMTGPGGRALVNGEIVAVYFNGWGYEANGQPSFAIYALSDGTSGRALASDLQGVAPVGSPPGLPADWWVPGLVKATKTCGSATAPGQPGVVEGGIYRASMLSGTHMKLADGQTSAPPIMWLVFATGAQQYTTGEVVVMGDCLIGTTGP